MSLEAVHSSHGAASARRKLMAEAVSAGEQAASVAKKFRVSEGTVRNACRIHSVKVPRLPCGRPPGGDILLPIVKCLIDGMDQGEIARRFVCSRQYIHQIAQRAVAAKLISKTTRASK